MQSSSQQAQAKQPQKVNHRINLVWWLLLVVTVLAIQELVDRINTASPQPEAHSTPVNNTEKEAFVALVFGKVSSSRELAISAYSFRKQLRAIKESGYTSVRLDRINHWRKSDDVSLPARPVLLTFEEADRETIEIADKMLARLGMTALVFVNIEELDQANIHRVSWHKLEEMAASGRWEIGLSGCPNKEDGSGGFPALQSQVLTQQRVKLEQRLRIPVVAADCSRAWKSDSVDGFAVWSQLLHEASLQTGFVAAPYGANYRDDPESGYRRIRVSKTWGQEELLAQLENHAPRRSPFVDTFPSDQPSAAWLVDSGEIAVQNGKLQIDNKNGEKGALITLSGTEKWHDAEAEIQLEGQPNGQFWLFLRYRAGQPSVRLGVAEGQVMLQEIDANGVVQRQLATLDAPSGTIQLKLRVIGSRAFGFLNGQPLLTRPAALPQGAHQGALAMAVWHKDEGESAVDSFNASAQLLQVNASPIIAQAGIVASRPDAKVLSQLREHSEQLSMLSPNFFAWIDGKPQDSEANDITLEIFARYHRLKLLPSLVLDENTRLSESAKLTEQALAWATNSAFDGLNLVVQDKMAESDEWPVFLRDLNHRFNEAGQTLTVTLLDSSRPVLTATDNDKLLLVAAQADLLSAGPSKFYPVNRKPIQTMPEQDTVKLIPSNGQKIIALTTLSSSEGLIP